MPVDLVKRRARSRNWTMRNRARKREMDRDWRLRNPELAKAAQARYRARHPDRSKWHRAKQWCKTHNINFEEYKATYEAHDGVCRICKADSPGTKKGWQLDHCHKTFRIRGMLCHHCNLLLGNARDSRAILFAAAEYLLCQS
jgi:hypothetical protein